MSGLRGCLLLVLCLCAGVARAADGPVVVELILFRYTAALEPARWPPATEVPDFSTATALQAGPAEGDTAWFTALPATALRLANASNALRRAGAYEVLLHTAWRQPGRAGGPLYLRSAPPADGSAPALEGTLQLRQAGQEIRLNGSFLVQVGEERVQVSPNQNFRPLELRYIDHALLGVLVQMRPVDDGEAAAEPPPPAPAGAGPGPTD